MNYRITTLAENSVYGKGSRGKHRLSLLVEAGEHKVLFDTGASDLLIRNARLMGVDLTDVEFAILFHEHRDHTGGLHAFLEMNSRAKMVYKQEVLHREFKNECGSGMLHPGALDKPRFWPIDEATEIVSGIFAFLDVRIVDRNDTHPEHFFVEIGGEICSDTFGDELTLISESEKPPSVLSACLHRGTTSIIRTMQTIFSGLGLKLVIEGSHIHNAGTEKFNVISAFLGMKPPKRLGVCHCTGIDRYALSRQQPNDRVFYNYAGWVETI